MVGGEFGRLSAAALCYSVLHVILYSARTAAVLYYGVSAILRGLLIVHRSLCWYLARLDG